MTDGRWNVLLPRQINERGPERLADVATFTDASEFGTSEAELLERRDRLARIDAILLRELELTADVIEAAENLKVISRHGIGLDNVDVEAATRSGVIVCNTPGTNTRAVAEHAMTLLFAVNRTLVQFDSTIRNSGWKGSDSVSPLLRGTSLGIFGCGTIGRNTAELADGVGLECLGYDPHVDAADLPEYVTLVEDKDEFFERADAVSVHCPLTPETQNAVSARELELLGESGLLVNTARGGIVSEPALVAALEDGTIRGAGIDVFVEEPPVDSPLLERDDVILSPHIAGATHEARENTAIAAAENIKTVYEGSVPETTVNRSGLGL